MKNEQILSVIVPSYKTKSYLGTSLPPFVSASLENKYIVYLVDDGSPDDTAVYLKECESRYPHIFKYIYKENGGHGSVINYAVHNIVKTKYFMVVDGDDNVNQEEFLKLVDALTSLDSDIVMTNNYIIKKNEKQLMRYYDYDCSCEIGINDLKYSLHSVVYKTQIWKDNNIVLTERVFYEDNQYCLYPKYFAKSAYFLPLNVYNYHLGVTGQTVTPKNMISHLGDLEKVLDDILIFDSTYNETNKKKIILPFAIDTEKSIYQSYYHYAFYYSSNIFTAFKSIKRLKSKYMYYHFMDNDDNSYSFIYLFFRRFFFEINSIRKRLFYIFHTKK